MFKDFSRGLKLAIEAIKKGEACVLPTDTVFGIVASALSEQPVQKIYQMRGRNENKPCIVLISDFTDLDKLGLKLSSQDSKILKEIWPASVSVVLDCPDPTKNYLHRGMGTLAVRMPKKSAFRRFLAETGPIIAPSANLEGLPPARKIEEAKEYFGDKVACYVPGRPSSSKPSTIIKIKNGRIQILREGGWQVPEKLKHLIQ